MSFIEIWEHYQFGTNAQRFVELRFSNDNGQYLVKGGLPRSHGISYYYMREQCKKDFGEVMGLDALLSGNEELIEIAKKTKDI